MVLDENLWNYKFRATSAAPHASSVYEILLLLPYSLFFLWLETNECMQTQEEDITEKNLQSEWDDIGKECTEA